MGGSLTIRRILVMRKNRNLPFDPNEPGGPGPDYDRDLMRKNRNPAEARRHGAIPGTSGANTDAPHGRPIGPAKDAAAATGEQARSRQQAIDSVTSGLEALSKDYPEAKSMLDQFQRTMAKWMTGNASPQDASGAPDEPDAGPDSELNEVMGNALSDLASKNHA